MRLWHFLRAPHIDDTLSKGAITPTGYNDLAKCEVKRIRGKRRYISPESNWCRHDHDRQPVTWLSAAPIAVAAYEGEPLFLFEVDTEAQPWSEWARQHGAEEKWIAERDELFEFTRRANLQGGEWVTTSPIPRSHWLFIRDMETGMSVSTNATWTPAWP